MDKFLYISMTGAKHNMLGQSVHSNNLANADTTGFRSDFVQARSQGVYYGDGHPTRAYAQTENPAIDMGSGALIETGRELDFAIKGDGLIAVQANDGNEAYTRSGALNIGANGEVMTANGLLVLGDGGPLVIPPAEKVDIGADGTISVVGLGQGAQNLLQVGRIKLVSIEDANLVKGEDGLIRSKDGEALPLDGNIRLESGFLEASNVNVIHEFTEVLMLSRQYEMNVKMMSQAQQNSEASARLLQIS